jgi:predicted NAD/FAD-dependent oxidoreductase
VEGSGQPCQPGALDPATGRVAFAQGVKAFPLHLAAGLTIRLETQVTAIRVVDGGFQVTAGESELRCRNLVLALALEQSRRLLKTLPAGPEVLGLQALLGLFASVPSLTLIAAYGLDGPAPDWDLLQPDSEVLQLVAHDSAKRQDPAFRILVAQARPRWSRQRLEAPAEQWAAELLGELGALVGPWASRPLWSCPHRWRYARVDSASELAGPAQLTFSGGQKLGLAGDLFAPGGGVQAAWLSGQRLAERLMVEEHA